MSDSEALPWQVEALTFQSEPRMLLSFLILPADSTISRFRIDLEDRFSPLCQLYSGQFFSIFPRIYPTLLF
jgi:hypothetical protein